ncbi:MAG: zinc ribbon domain-containing protein [Clostridia bacterium]|nr:zinc ribbon domain-containing protein [Clostridia bacterium]
MGFCHNCNKEVSSKFCPNCGGVISNDDASKSESSTLINQLYTLRAGLSRIYNENDKVICAENDLAEKERYNDDTTFKYKRESLDQHYESILNSKINYLSRDFKRQNDENLVEKKKLENAFNSSKKDFNKILALLITFISLFLLFGGLFTLAAVYSSELGGFAYLGLLIFLIVSIVYIVKLVKEKKYLNRAEANLNSFLRSTHVVSEENMEKLFRASDEYKNLVDEYESKRTAYLEAKNFDYSQLVNNIVIAKNSCAMLYKKLYPSFISKFESTLNSADWSNIDLILFNLETGRANTLKEALLQIDQSKGSSGRGVNFENATKMVCKSIESSHTKMRQMISSCVASMGAPDVEVEELHQALISASEVKSYDLNKILKNVADYQIEEVKSNNQKKILGTK